MRPLVHRAESTARSFALTGDQEFATEYHRTSNAILPALDSLIETVKGSPGEKRLIEETKALVERQIASNGELIRLRNAGDDAGIAALVSREDRAATAAIAGNLEKAVAEARRQLAARRAESEVIGRILLAIDLAGVALIIRARPMRMADSTAVSLTTGSAPGSPRQTGQTFEFGSAPKFVPQPQNILDAVFSSMWTSSPMTGSYRVRPRRSRRAHP